MPPRRLTLISPAMSGALRQARFYDGEGSLDEAAAAQARATASSLPNATHTTVSPGRRCGETASALGLDAEETPALATLHVGRWQGRTLDEVSTAEPEALAAWLSDPDRAPHGGESVRDLCARVGAWLESLDEGRTIAVAEPDALRAAVVHALRLPVEAFWRLDVRPLTATELSGRAGRWNLHLGHPLTPEAR